MGASSERTRSPGADVVAWPRWGRGHHRCGTRLRQPGHEAVPVDGLSLASGNAAEICRRSEWRRRSRRAAFGEYLPNSAAAALVRSG